MNTALKWFSFNNQICAAKLSSISNKPFLIKEITPLNKSYPENLTKINRFLIT